MNVHMIGELPCPACGYRNRCLHSAAVRINKKTLKSTGPSMTFVPSFCTECRTPLPDPPTRWRLAPEDQARVDAYRARRFQGAAS